MEGRSCVSVKWIGWGTRYRGRCIRKESDVILGVVDMAILDRIHPEVLKFSGHLECITGGLVRIFSFIYCSLIFM